MIEPVQTWVGEALSLLGYLLNQEPEVIFRFFWLFFLFDLPWHLISNGYALSSALFSSDKQVNRENRREIMRRQPLVSIIVPAWNEEASILQTISSLEKQNYPYREIIVVNDGSDDGTHSICRDLVRQGRIRYFPLRVRSGKSAALNYGVRFSRGEFIVFVDSDSFFDSDAVGKPPKIFSLESNILKSVLRRRNPCRWSYWSLRN